MNPFPKLIAIGGGGFTHGSDPEMEDFILAQIPVARPRVGYIGSANNDDPIRVAAFHSRFGAVCQRHTHLPMGASAADAQSWLTSLDMVYVGGGDTLHLLKSWRTDGVDQVMVAAAQRGVLMVGVSAGANVWFKQALSDSGGLGLAPVDCIGLVRGSCCPHYSTEPLRPPAFMAGVAQGAIADGIAIDDGAAVLIDGAGQLTVFSARPGSKACSVRRVGQTALCEPLKRYERRD